MKKQYVFIEKLEDGKEVRYSFDTKKEIKNFIDLVLIDSDFESFEIKIEYVGVSI